MTADLINTPPAGDNNVVVATETSTEKADNKEPPSQLSQLLLPPTNMLYYTYKGNNLTTCHAKVLFIQENKTSTKTTTGGGSADDEDKTKIEEENNSNDNDHDSDNIIVDVCLDQTILHAQGGGQPTDFGSLQLLVNNNNDNDCNDSSQQGENEQVIVVVHVDKVLMDRTTGVATHTGRLVFPDYNKNKNDKLMLQVGDVVQVTVDKERRQILSECHTAGHVVDAAMAKCGHLLKPSKGYHFLDGPYVEYKGSIPADKKDQVLLDLQDAYCQLVNDDIETKIELLSKQEADEICNQLVPNYFDMDAFVDVQNNNQIRVVTVAGYPCPCGGTHVLRTSDLKQRQWNITGIKSKKGLVRVKYGPGTNGIV